jgi:3-oxoacyl-[acyl-carrier-protein] synthase-3
MLRSRIAGVGGYVPPHLVRNEDLEGPMEISADAIERRTGIRQRYWADRDPRLATSDLALQASLRALEHAGLPAEALELLIVATLSPDASAPATACFLQEKLGVPGIAAFDVRAQCSGFLYGLELADLYLRAGRHKHVLVVGAELQSKLLDMTPRGRNVTVLFGDGAGAVVLSAAEVADVSRDSRESFLYSTHLHSDGALLGHLLWQHPGSMNPQYVTPNRKSAARSHAPSGHIASAAVARRRGSRGATCTSTCDWSRRYIVVRSGALAVAVHYPGHPRESGLTRSWSGPGAQLWT